MGLCVICGKKTAGSRKTCSQECRNLRRAQVVAETNRKYASERMKKNNPMRNPETREKVSKTLKEIGHKPSVQGGNGKQMPEPQKLLYSLLASKGFTTEYAIPTKMGRYSGYPTCYKVDLGNPKIKLAIEIDGFSHSAIKRQEQDKKKTAFLNTLGWQILRFSNAEVMNGTEKCMAQITSTILKLKERTLI